jgi:hypothetical protein
MSIEHFYWFIDREVVDPVLEMSWKAFLRKYPWDRDFVDDIFMFALDPELDADAISHILENHTLRWTMKRASPGYWFLNHIVHHVRALERRCPSVWPEYLYESAVLDAASVEAFLEGKISEEILWAVYNINGLHDPRVFLQLPRRELWNVEIALGSGAVENPIYRWQSDECLTEGYSCLGLRDTKRFIAFLHQAWNENWPVPRLNEEARKELELTNKTHHFRDFDLPSDLIACLEKARPVKPCTVQYFERL